MLALAVRALAAFAFVRANDLRFDFRAGAGESRSDRALPLLPMPEVSRAELSLLVPPGGFGIHPAVVGLNRAVDFYAWRSLWPAAHAGDTQPMAVAQRFGLGAAPHVLLLPKHPWPAIAAELAEFKRVWVKNLAPDRESEHWRAWNLH